MAATRAKVAQRRVVSSTRSASRCPRQRGLASRSWPRASRAARTASSASLLAPVGVAGRLGRPLGAADLHHPLAMLGQERGRAGAEAARALDRPAATARTCTRAKSERSPSEVEESLVAGRVGAGGELGQHAAKVGDDGGGEGVWVGVDADGRRRRVLPAWASRWSSLVGAAVVGVGLGGVTARHNAAQR